VIEVGVREMLNRARWTACVTAVLLAATAGTAGTALGDRQVFEDDHGNVAASVDVHEVIVVNGTASHHRVRIVVEQRELEPGDEIDVWIDSNSANPGPEYRAGAKANTDAFGLLKVQRWGSRGRVVDAPRFVVHSDATTPIDSTVFLIPRHAIGDPGAIRVSARVQRQTPHGWVRDWAPVWHGFYDSVAETS
jgi:hypothetical protein